MQLVRRGLVVVVVVVVMVVVARDQEVCVRVIEEG